MGHTEEMKKALKGSGSSSYEPAFCSIENWCILSGMSRRSTYERLGTGDLKAVKFGSKTLLDVEFNLAWLRSLPPAVIKAPRPRQQADTTL
jgi:hypothetical protein